MKVYLLYKNYYDFCQTWNTLIGIFDSEEKAKQEKEIEEKSEDYDNLEQFSTHIEEWDLK